MQISTTYLEKQKRLIKICLPNILTAMFLFVSASLFYIAMNKLKWIIVLFTYVTDKLHGNIYSLNVFFFRNYNLQIKYSRFIILSVRNACLFLCIQVFFFNISNLLKLLKQVKSKLYLDCVKFLNFTQFITPHASTQVIFSTNYMF